MNYYDDLVPVQIVATIWILPDADVYQVVNDMDYSFEHEAIKDYEIRDINTEI